MRELDLRMFDDPVTYTVTVKYDTRYVESVTLDHESGEYAENESIVVTPEFESGYRLWRAFIYDGGNKISTKKNLSGIKMGTSDMTILLVTSTAAVGEYYVREPVMIDINGARTRVDPGGRIKITDGEIYKSNRKTIGSSDAVDELIKQGILIPYIGEGSTIEVEIVD